MNEAPSDTTAPAGARALHRSARSSVPVSAPAAPIDDKQAEAAQLEQQINDNGRRIDALNEQINSAQIALDAANAAITTADAQVAAARRRPRTSAPQLAARAVVGLHAVRFDGRRRLISTRRTPPTSAARQKYTAVAAQREKQLVNQLARAKEELAARKADAEDARAVAEKTQAADRIDQGRPDAGDSKQRALLAQVKGDIADARRAAGSRAPRRRGSCGRAQRHGRRRRHAGRRAAPTATPTAERERQQRWRRRRLDAAASRPRRAAEPAPRSRTRTRSSASPTATPASAPSATTARGSR